jgi:hypothetical protein
MDVENNQKELGCPPYLHVIARPTENFVLTILHLTKAEKKKCGLKFVTLSCFSALSALSHDFRNKWESVCACVRTCHDSFHPSAPLTSQKIKLN